MDDESDDAQFFAALSRELMREHEETPTFDHVVRSAVQVIGPCDMAGISLIRRHRIESVAATDEIVEECDGLQHALDEGPCVSATKHDEVYVAHDLTDEPRWPRWSRAAADLGVGSVVAVRLSTREETLGALNFYSREKDAWTQDDLDLALVYAAHATNAMVSARLVTGLTTAVNRRHTIGVAEGVLMGRHHLEVEEAFELLTSIASRNDLPLHELAARVVEERGVPAELVPDADAT